MDKAPDPADDDSAAVVGKLFEQHSRALHRYLASRVGAVIADDLVGDTFVAALRGWTSFNLSRGTPSDWLFEIATNLLRNHHRAEARHLAATTRHLNQAISSTPAEHDREHRVDASIAAKRLVPDLLRLDLLDRDILLLNAWAGLTPTEIAVALEMPPGTVRSRLHRLRADLRAARPAAESTTAATHPRTFSATAPPIIADPT